MSRRGHSVPVLGGGAGGREEGVRAPIRPDHQGVQKVGGALDPGVPADPRFVTCLLLQTEEPSWPKND